LRAWLYPAMLVFLLAAFIVLELALLDRRSMMVDDTIHIPSGYSYLKTHDFRLNEEHPPFIKVLSAIGLEHVQPELPLDSEGWSKAEEPGDPNDGTDTFCGDFFHRNADKFEQIIYWARLPVIIVPVLLAITVWLFSRSLFGDFAAVVAVFFLLSEPNIIANSTFVQDDLASALAVFCFVLSLRAYFMRPAFIRALVLGLAIAFGLLVKHSLAAMVPVTILLLVVHAIWRRAKHKEHLCRYIGLELIALACTYFIFIAGYGFNVSFIDDDEAAFISEWLKLDWSDPFQNVLVHIPILLPKYYLYGMDLVMNDVQNGRPAFLLGDVSQTGWWYYFPVAFVLKTTIPFLMLTVSGICWTVWEIIKRRWLDGLYLIIPPLGYLALSMTSHLDIGVRHIMPVFPFFAVMGAGEVAAFLNIEAFKSSRFSSFAVCVLIAWIAAIAFATFPCYTTYFSPIAGGSSNGWRLLSDSNVETGQDVKDLAKFLKDRGESQVEGLFVGSGYIEYYGVENCEIPCNPDTDNDNEEAGGDGDSSQSDEQSPEPDSTEAPPKYIAIGAWYLEEIDFTPEQKAVIDQYRSAQPEAVIGNAIFVFQRKQN
jgi:hypothetical protein